MAVTEVIEFWTEPEEEGTRMHVIALVEDAVEKLSCWEDPPEYYNAYCDTDFLILPEETIPKTNREVLNYLNDTGVETFDWTPACYE